ncbi:MAG: hypothetical protein A3B11_02155 [Candidatus Taylorbacteria bacterium RIFCSPLOWO2_01_FULL_44_26]|uniref:Large ribosomal subunit protein bL25 n=2 Tax=Candidatus Tayloriibacteriota TaxID=1817919 RepID=A0A1G2MK83_9BACT|nr:MAG: hypothetical protein A3D50_02280 [Candidatus Taylorbacteria bacterium RIFCSPHIGHO2_02_FULL_44_12]OHA30770.1 MAG: hypothetical protein A3B11_02155 [Candidatus Taylorbacteria bacterium RIFCSPLOWO2_01_FULL_44_26]
MLSLLVKTRDSRSNNQDLRAKGVLPAVFYGPKQSSTTISVSMTDFKKVWKKAGESSVVNLKGENDIDLETLIHEVDIHPVSGEPRHADFYVIEKGKKVQVSVPLVFAGVAPAVKEKGGILVKVLREIEIEAAPKDLPHDISVDVSRLAKMSDVIQAKDLALPAGVRIKTNPEDIVASIAEAHEEIEETPSAIDMSAIEVEAKGKEVKEGDKVEEGIVDKEKPEEKGKKKEEGIRK